MIISRRHLLRQIGATAAAAAAVPPLAEASSGIGAGPSETGRLVRLGGNENAYGPSEKAIATMVDAARNAANRYAGAEEETLRHTIARFHSVTPEQVVVGSGSSEILRMAADAFTGPRNALIVADRTVALMADCARRAGAEIVAVPLRPDYAHDLPAMLARCDDTTGLVYICNPHNPTGSLTRRRDLEAFIRQLPETIHVVIDEAYHHYAGESSDYASFIERPVDDRQLIVTRTFSKVYGLAGLRVGYGIAAPQTVRALTARRVAAALNIVAVRAAIAALGDSEHVRISVARNVDDRQEFVNQAHARMLKPIDSQANFVMLNTERPAVDVVDHFKQYDVMLAQPMPSFEKHVRVSLGTPAEMSEFWAVWDLMSSRHRSM